jgi:hypothetical protein
MFCYESYFYHNNEKTANVFFDHIFSMLCNNPNIFKKVGRLRKVVLRKVSLLRPVAKQLAHKLQN